MVQVVQVVHLVQMVQVVKVVQVVQVVQVVHVVQGVQGGPGDQVCQCIWFTWSKQSDYRKNLRCHCVYFCSLVIFILSKTVSYPEWSVCQGPCRELKPCVECQAFGSGQLKEVNSKHLLLPIFTCTADPVSQKR